MKRYEAYKDSGVQWIGEIPRHWEARKVRTCFKERREKVSDKEFEALSVSKMGITPQLDSAVKTDNGDNRKKVCKGDFVVNSRSDRKGSCGFSEYDGSVSLINIVLAPFNVVGEYYHYLFRSNDYIEEFYRQGRGIVADLWTTRYSEMKSIYIPVPPLSEQHAIVDYLKDKTHKIDEYVAARERERELLESLKQSEIANIVTKGLNQNAPMKDSGIPWIGMIPEHWELCRNKDIFTESKHVVGDNSDNYTLLSLTKQGVIIRDLSESKGKFPKEFNNYKVVEPGDIIFCLFDMDETPRTVGLSTHHGMITGAYDVFKIKRILPQYILYYYLAIDDRKAMRPLYKGLRKVVPMPTFMSSKIPAPPLSEQQAIVAYIDEKLSKIDRCLADLQAEIDYLKEFKQRLISDVVTGQICVAEPQKGDK